MNEVKKTAPVRMWVVLCAVAAVLLMAAGICFAHSVNAVAIQGILNVEDCVQTNGSKENLVPIVEEVWDQEKIIHIGGALMRMNQTVEAVNVRAALIDQMDDRKSILLKTQMVRRQDLKEEYRIDDHCGFHATVRSNALESGRYRIVLIDQSGKETLMIETGCWIGTDANGLSYVQIRETGLEGNGYESHP